jgi:DNA-binding response OmpR family regulator
MFPMKGRLYLIHWHRQEAAAIAKALRAKGWQVDVEPQDAARAHKAIGANPPDAVLIYLTRDPYQGGEMARALLASPATRTLPIALIDGADEGPMNIRLKAPQAVYLRSAELDDWLDQLRPLQP